MGSDFKLSGLDFGFVIAFVAPGFVAFYALTYHIDTAREWISAATNADQGVGLFLFILLVSLAMGLIVSGVRARTIDNLLRWAWLLRRYTVPKIDFGWGSLDEKKLAVLLAVRDAFLPHYQFYANTLVALLFWGTSRATSNVPCLPLWQWVAIGVAAVALLLSAHDSLLRYTDAVNQVFQPK